MSMSFGSKKSKTTQTTNQDPWDTAVPYIEKFLGSVPTGASAQITPEQSSAYSSLKQIAGEGNPNAGQMLDLAREQGQFQSQSGTAGSGYADLQRRLGGTADGTNVSLDSNPYLQRMLQQVGDEARNRTNASFAAAGREMSGMNQQAVSRGVAQAQLPIMMDQYNREVGRSDQAARDLYGAGNTTASTMQGLDADAMQQRLGLIDTTKAALEAKGWGQSQILQLEEQMKQLPLDQLERIGNLLYSAGQLGKQEIGTGTSKSSGFSLGLNLLK